MDLKNLSDQVLMEKTEILVQEEREILTAVLHHLLEIEHRRLFADFGFKSLYDFTVRKLGYSEDQAYRRIAAMRLLKELPQMEEKINKGEVSLSHIGLAQSFFKKEAKKLSADQKMDLLERISNTSVREAERITLSLSSEITPKKPDRVKAISENEVEIYFSVDKSLQEKIETLRGLLAHQHPGITLGELFEKLCDLGLKEWNPSSPAASRKRRVANILSRQKQAKVRNEVGAMNTTNIMGTENTTIECTNTLEVRRLIFRRAQNKCENCGSQYALQVDHIFARALGGTDSPGNLRLLCRSCNQRAAVKQLGAKKMSAYF